MTVPYRTVAGGPTPEPGVGTHRLLGRLYRGLISCVKPALCAPVTYREEADGLQSTRGQHPAWRRRQGDQGKQTRHEQGKFAELRVLLAIEFRCTPCDTHLYLGYERRFS